MYGPELTVWLTVSGSTLWCASHLLLVLQLSQADQRPHIARQGVYSYNTVQYSTVKYSTVQYSTVQQQYSSTAVQYSSTAAAGNGVSRTKQYGEGGLLWFYKATN